MKRIGIVSDSHGMRGMLEREDRPALEEMFIHSTRRRALFDR